MTHAMQEHGSTVASKKVGQTIVSSSDVNGIQATLGND